MRLAPPACAVLAQQRQTCSHPWAWPLPLAFTLLLLQLARMSAHEPYQCWMNRSFPRPIPEQNVDSQLAAEREQAAASATLELGPQQINLLKLDF